MGVSENVYRHNSLNYIPSIVTMRDNLYDRTREGAAAASSCEPGRRVIATAQYNHSSIRTPGRSTWLPASPSTFSRRPSITRLSPPPTLNRIQPGPDRVRGHR